MSDTNGSNNGKSSASYAAAAGVDTNDGNAGVLATAVTDQPFTPVTDSTPKVGEPIDHNKVEGGRRWAGRPVLMGAGLFVAVIIIGALAAYFMFLRGSGAMVVKTTVRNQGGAGQELRVSDEKLTADAIAHARSQVAPTAMPDAAGTPGTAPTIIVQQPSESVVPVKVGTTTLNTNAGVNSSADAPVVRPADGVAGTVNANADANTNSNTARASSPSSGGGSGRSRSPVARGQSKANGQKSLIYGDDEAGTVAGDSDSGASRGARTRAVNAGFAIGMDGARSGETKYLAVRPSFGALLPVRTLGAIYTLRAGGLVRMELTRDVGGPGWKLPRRTVIVGTLRGGEFDRAYISVVGYIDSSSGRLVTFGGSLLGADAGEGMKGERKQVTGRWSRVLGQLAEKSFALAQTALGSRSGATIVLGDAGRPELSALTQNGDRREFVVVKAGSMGYVSVTDLPKEVEGVDALSQLNPDALAQLLDAGANTGTGLGDEEVAQLLSSGSNAQIRAAMPRMNENMRRLAEQVISQSER